MRYFGLKGSPIGEAARSGHEAGLMLQSTGGGVGFRVDPAGLTGVAGQVGKAYDDLNGAIADFHGGDGLPPDAFGDSGVADAWVAFSAAWSHELSLTREALAELVRKVSTTAQRYEEGEAAIVASVNRAGGAA